MLSQCKSQPFQSGLNFARNKNGQRDRPTEKSKITFKRKGSLKGGWNADVYVKRFLSGIHSDNRARTEPRRGQHPPGTYKRLHRGEIPRRCRLPSGAALPARLGHRALTTGSRPTTSSRGWGQKKPPFAAGQGGSVGGDPRAQPRGGPRGGCRRRRDTLSRGGCARPLPSHPTKPRRGPLPLPIASLR